MPVELKPQRIEKQTPMMMEISRAELLTLINEQLRNQGPAAGQLPDTVQVTVYIPSDAPDPDEHENEYLAERLIFRWKQ